MRYAAIALASVLLVAAAVQPAAAQSGSGWNLWTSIIQRLSGYIRDVQQVINLVRDYVFGYGTIYSFQGGLPSVLGVDLVQDIAGRLLSQLQFLPQDLRSYISALYSRITSPQNYPIETTAGLWQRVANLSPPVSEDVRKRVETEAAAASAATQAAAVAKQSAEAVKQLAEDTSLSEAMSRATADAEFLRTASEDVQSTRALMQLLNEGVANLMVQNAAFAEVLTTHLQALAQQTSMTNQELSAAVAILAQILLRQEAAKERSQMSQAEVLRQTLSTFGTSLGGIAKGGQSRTQSDRIRDALGVIFGR